jgi:hypothetical protein
MIATTKATIHLADPEEQVVVEVDGRDRRAFEIKGRRDLGLPHGDLQAQIKAAAESWMAWVCWHAATRTGEPVGSWAEFDARLVAVEPDDDGGDSSDADPTRPAASAG